MSLPLEETIAFSPENLNNYDTDLIVSLYDEVVVSLDRDDRERNVVHKRIHSRLLGSVTIPFSSLLVTKVVLSSAYC